MRRHSYHLLAMASNNKVFECNPSSWKHVTSDMNHRKNNLHFACLVCLHNIQLKIGLLTRLTLPNLPANDDTVDLVAYSGNLLLLPGQHNLTYVYLLVGTGETSKTLMYMKGKIVNSSASCSVSVSFRLLPAWKARQKAS